MITINHTRLRMSGALNIEHLTALKLHIGVNTHGWAVVEGEAGETALEQLSGALAGREQHILTLDESGAEKCLFAGVIREAELVRVGGYNRFHVELLSGTCLMDREVRSRSFQDVDRTYSQVAQQVCSEYSGGAAICTVGEDKTLGQPVIQYRETDWEFLMRMASHCGGVLVPETHRGLPRLWFGFPDRSFTCKFPEDAYTSGISQRYYELGGSAAGYSKADFFYYDVESPQLCDLGWYSVFKGQPFFISEKYAILERGELIFTYRLGRPGLGWGKMLYNEKISGMTLLGEVLETSRETLKLKLDIDEGGWNPGGPYPYTWRPETGNFMYCMPQVGTRVSLYCPNYDEKTAIAVNCVRTNGGDCDRMSDPAKRSFVTEHGKELNLYPNMMSLLGGNEEQAQISDETGIFFGGPKPVFVTAKYKVQMEARSVRACSHKDNLVLAKMNYHTGEVKSSYYMLNDYHSSAQKLTSVEGRVHKANAPFNDTPQESIFNDFGFLANFAFGMLVSGALWAACIVATGGAATIILGCMAIGAAVATVSMNAADRKRGQPRSFLEAVNTVLWGALTGAAAGAAIVLAPYAAEALVAQFFPLGLPLKNLFLTDFAMVSLSSKGLSALAFLFAGIQFNNIDSMARADGTNFMCDVLGLNRGTYDTLNTVLTILTTSLILVPGVCNPRFSYDLITGGTTIDDVIVQGNQDLHNAIPAKSQAHETYAEVEIHGRINTELDEVDLTDKIIYEDKNGSKLYMQNPDYPQTEEQWAEKQIFKKTVGRITALQQEDFAVGNINSQSSLPLPSKEELQQIRTFIFRIDADTPALREAVENVIKRLAEQFPEYSFSAIYGYGGK